MTKNEEKIIDIDEFEIPEGLTVQRKIISNPIWYNIPIDFWKQDLTFQIDDKLYFDMRNYLNPKAIFTKKIFNEYKFEKCKDFEKKDLWFLIKFFFIASRFHHINPSSNIISFCGGVPQGLKILCKCGNLLNEASWLKGYFQFSTISTMICYMGSLHSEHEFYFRISEECPKCKKMICIYRPKRGVLFPLMLFLGSIVPDYFNLKLRYDLSNLNVLLGWCHIIEKIYTSNSKKILKLYHDDIEKFIRLTERIPKELERKFKFYNLKNKYREE